MWKCKRCGDEITVKANIEGLYRVFLDENKKIIDYDDWEELNLSNGKIIVAICDECGDRCSTVDELEKIAAWED